MDLTVLHLAVPELSADLQPSSAQLLWIIDIYGFMVAGSLITMGTLGDRIGRRRLLMIGAAAFGVASVLAAFSTSAEMLIATRALLGIAGRDARAVDAVADPQHVPRPAAAHDRDRHLDHELLGRRRDRPAARRRCCSSSSGGARSFLLAVPVMVLLLVLGPRLLPEYRDPERRAARPGRAPALSLAAVLAVIFGLKQIAQDGIGRLRGRCRSSSGWRSASLFVAAAASPAPTR